MQTLNSGYLGEFPSWKLTLNATQVLKSRTIFENNNSEANLVKSWNTMDVIYIKPTLDQTIINYFM